MASSLSEDATSTFSMNKQTGKISEVVADHYNNLDEKGLEERTKSRIFYLRNFNNWIKSMLIGEYLDKVKQQNSLFKKEVTVLDLCCGKGGDLLKWKVGGIDYLVCADIAETSVQQCEKRYNDMWNRSQYERRQQKQFKAEFISADCTKVRLKDHYKKKDISFDLVSCQFSFHYCFESLPQVDQMLQNISECLRSGGYFIGTTPDACQIVSKLQKSENLSFGNNVYSVTFQNKTEFPLFGATYNFHLEGVVDCPEFLVYFPLLEKLAERYQLKLVYCERFDKFYNEVMQKDSEKSNHYDSGRQLLGRMQALESYPAFDASGLMSNDEKDYIHAKEKVESIEKASGRPERVGTLSQAEWEAICLYVVFVFEKRSEKTDESASRKRKNSEDDSACCKVR